LCVPAGQPPGRCVVPGCVGRRSGVQCSTCGARSGARASCGVPGLAWCTTSRQPCALRWNTWVVVTRAVPGPVEVMTLTLSTRWCTAVWLLCQRARHCGRASMDAPLANKASKLARMSAGPIDRAPPGWMHAMSPLKMVTLVLMTMSNTSKNSSALLAQKICTSFLFVSPLFQL